MSAVADSGFVLLRLHVHDDVASGQRIVQRLLDLVCSGMALADRSAGWNRDDDVRELAWAGLAHAQAPDCHRGLDAGDRRPRRFLRAGGDAIHQDVDVDLHQARGGQQHEHGNEQRRRRVRPHVAGAHEQ